MASQQEQERAQRSRWKKFAQTARVVLMSAQEHAVKLNADSVGEGHIFLALMNDEGIVKMLGKLNLDPERIKEATKLLMGHGEERKSEGEIGFNTRGRRIFELAVGEAKNRKDKEIIPADILMGVILCEGGLGAGILESLWTQNSSHSFLPLFQATRNIVLETQTADNTKPEANAEIVNRVAFFLGDPNIDPIVRRRTIGAMDIGMKLAQKSKPKSGSST